MSRSRLCLVCGLCGVAFVVFAAWLIGGWGGPSTVLAVSDVGSVLAGATAVTCAAVTARRCRGRQRRAWTALTVALAGWLFGDAVWAYYELVLRIGTAPFPSPADAGYLLFPVAACVALVLLPIGSVGQWHRIFDAFDDPFPVDGHDVFMRPSVGVATGHADGTTDGSAAILLKQADQAMYAAKRSQHGGVMAYTADMQLIDQAEVDPPTDRGFTTRRSGSAGLQLFAQLRRAIDRGELSVLYQPKFTVSTGRVEGVEALVRWEHPDRGMMLPGEFLPLARQNGLMGALTEAVIDQAVRDAAGWRADGADVPLAVNLFPPSLTDLELPNRIVRILEAGGLGTDRLTVEITEDFLLGNTRRARTVLEMLRERRIRVSIDDFGSGYSALSYLRELPIDEVKLDREFIAPMLTDDRAEAIVSAMIDLAHRLDMTCVAEGVEDSATAVRLAEHGCDIVQGFFCSPPIAAARVLAVRPLWPDGRPLEAYQPTDARRR